MASTNWGNVVILNSPLTNAIYIGKLNKTGLVSDDKSDDRTSEIISAVMGHMDRDATKKCKDSVTWECPAGTLVYTKKGASDNG